MTGSKLQQCGYQQRMLSCPYCLLTRTRSLDGPFVGHDSSYPCDSPLPPICSSLHDLMTTTRRKRRTFRCDRELLLFLQPLHGHLSLCSCWSSPRQRPGCCLCCCLSCLSWMYWWWLVHLLLRRYACRIVQLWASLFAHCCCWKMTCHPHHHRQLSVMLRRYPWSMMLRHQNRQERHYGRKQFHYRFYDHLHDIKGDEEIGYKENQDL